MNTEGVEFFWKVLHDGLIHRKPLNVAEMHAQLFTGEFDLHTAIETRLDAYFNRQDAEDLTEAALIGARSFFFASEMPGEHLVLIAFLLRKKYISAEDACNLAQIDASSFSLMSESARDIVRLAETISEEQRIGFMAASDDDLLEASLLEYCESKGIFFDQPGT